MAADTQLKPFGGFTGVTVHELQNPQSDSKIIPLVGHVITDDDIGALQGSKIQPVNLTKVIKLLTDQHSLLLFDRHLHALKKICKHYKDGFIMRELVLVFKVLNICADRVDQHPVYTEPLVSLLKICSLPFLKEKSSDEITYEQIAVEAISQLGYLMRVPSNEVRLQICETIIQFYSQQPPAQLVQKHQGNTLSYNQGLVEKSDLAETLVKSLALLENDVNIKIAVLSVLQVLSKNSGRNCDMMLRADGAQRLCSRLMDYDPSGQVLFRSVDIIWNLLEHASGLEVAEQLNNFACISQLRDAFISQLTQGYSHYDRQLRNDLLVIASLIATCCLQAPFLETGFVKQLALLGTFQEVKSHNALVKHLKLMTNHEDFELKKLLLNILVLLSKDRSVIPVLSEGKLLLALFSFVKANEKTSNPQEWTVAQFEELQLHAMSALCALGPLMIEDYMTCQGSTRLLLLLEWCVGPAQNMVWYNDYLGTGNSFHGAGGRDNKKAQMRYCLRLIRSMVSTGEEQVLQDFTDQGAINQLISIMTKITKNRKPVENAVDIEMQGDMLVILSTLCENDVHRKELFGCGGVDVVLEYLRTDVSLLTSGLGHNRLLLAAIDCVWCAVVGCYITEDYFLEKEGVFLLLDLLETCPKNMHNLTLGCLLDLCENPKTTAHVNSWRGRQDVSAAHLLCEIWRGEEKDMGVAREQNGQLSDILRPLMGSYQGSSETISLPASHASQAIVDVSENMRSKVYALFCKIGFIELPGLTTDDHVTLTIIEHYLDFKLGEVWTEVVRELEADRIRPITPDREALEAISRTVEDRAGHVSMVQRELLEAHDQQSLIDEQEFYAEIRENHRQKEKAIKDFNEYVARTSNYALLKAAKERQELSVDASRVATNYKHSETFHGTDLPNLAATALLADCSSYEACGLSSASLPCSSSETDAPGNSFSTSLSPLEIPQTSPPFYIHAPSSPATCLDRFIASRRRDSRFLGDTSLYLRPMAPLPLTPSTGCSSLASDTASNQLCAYDVITTSPTSPDVLRLHTGLTPRHSQVKGHIHRSQHTEDTLGLTPDSGWNDGLTPDSGWNDGLTPDSAWNEDEDGSDVSLEPYMSCSLICNASSSGSGGSSISDGSVDSIDLDNYTFSKSDQTMLSAYSDTDRRENGNRSSNNNTNQDRAILEARNSGSVDSIDLDNYTFSKSDQTLLSAYSDTDRRENGNRSSNNNTSQDRDILENRNHYYNNNTSQHRDMKNRNQSKNNNTSLQRGILENRNHYSNNNTSQHRDTQETENGNQSNKNNTSQNGDMKNGNRSSNNNTSHCHKQTDILTAAIDDTATSTVLSRGQAQTDTDINNNQVKDSTDSDTETDQVHEGSNQQSSCPLQSGILNQDNQEDCSIFENTDPCDGNRTSNNRTKDNNHSDECDNRPRSHGANGSSLINEGLPVVAGTSNTKDSEGQSSPDADVSMAHIDDSLADDCCSGTETEEFEGLVIGADSEESSSSPAGLQVASRPWSEEALNWMAGGRPHVRNYMYCKSEITTGAAGDASITRSQGQALNHVSYVVQTLSGSLLTNTVHRFASTGFYQQQPEFEEEPGSPDVEQDEYGGESPDMEQTGYGGGSLNVEQTEYGGGNPNVEEIEDSSSEHGAICATISEQGAICGSISEPEAVCGSISHASNSSSSDRNINNDYGTVNYVEGRILEVKTVFLDPSSPLKGEEDFEQKSEYIGEICMKEQIVHISPEISESETYVCPSAEFFFEGNEDTDAEGAVSELVIEGDEGYNADFNHWSDDSSDSSLSDRCFSCMSDRWPSSHSEGYSIHSNHRPNELNLAQQQENFYDIQPGSGEEPEVPCRQRQKKESKKVKEKQQKGVKSEPDKEDVPDGILFISGKALSIHNAKKCSNVQVQNTNNSNNFERVEDMSQMFKVTDVDYGVDATSPKRGLSKEEGDSRSYVTTPQQHTLEGESMQHTGPDSEGPMDLFIERGELALERQGKLAPLMPAYQSMSESTVSPHLGSEIESGSADRCLSQEYTSHRNSEQECQNNHTKQLLSRTKGYCKLVV